MKVAPIAPKAVVIIKANVGKKEITDRSGSHVSFGGISAHFKKW